MLSMLIVERPPNQVKFNMEDHSTFLKYCILKIEPFDVLRLISYPF